MVGEVERDQRDGRTRRAGGWRRRSGGAAAPIIYIFPVGGIPGVARGTTLTIHGTAPSANQYGPQSGSRQRTQETRSRGQAANVDSLSSFSLFQRHNMVVPAVKN
jgi:hypothetical protein